MQTNEEYRKYEWLNNAPAEPVPAGPLFSLPLPPAKVRRWCWLAAGSFLQDAVDDYWYVFGRLDFFRAGSKTGELLFNDASSRVPAAARAAAPRLVLRLRPDGLGSRQPVLKYEQQDGTFVRSNLDLPAFYIEVEADRVDYCVEKTYYGGNAAHEFKLLLGTRILSL